MQEATPWSTDRCVATTRVLLNIVQLKAALAHQSELLFDLGKAS